MRVWVFFLRLSGIAKDGRGYRIGQGLDGNSTFAANGFGLSKRLEYVESVRKQEKGT